MRAFLAELAPAAAILAVAAVCFGIPLLLHANGWLS